MEPSIWEMQQEAARRVERMRQTSRQIAFGQNNDEPPPFPRRTAASMRAHRPSPYVSLPPTSQTNTYPYSAKNHPQSSRKPFDREQLLLLCLVLVLAKSDASPQLILALLYLAF